MAFLKNNRPNPRQIAEANSALEQAVARLRTAVGDLRRAADAVALAYQNLKANAALKVAMAELRKDKPVIKLGPSDRFNKAVSELIGIEKMMGAYAAPARRKR